MRPHLKPILCWTAVLMTFALAGCETAPLVAEAARAETAAIGIQIKTIGALGAISTQTAQQAYFVKLEGGSVLGEDIARSNFGKEGRLYLLNASPGTYVVVASSISTPPVLTYGSPGRQTTFFGRDLVELTRVEARANELAFAGNFEVSMSTALSGGDEVQLYYRKLISPSAPPTGFWGGMLQSLGGENSSWGSVRASDKGAAARAEFLKGAREDLAGQGWDTKLVHSD